MKKINAIQLNDFHSVLPPRTHDAHKGLFGHVLVVGGDYGMAGAARLAAEAALRVGAGLVSVATQTDHVSAIVSGRPEIMAHGIKETKDLNPLLAKASVIVAGIGFTQTSWSNELMSMLFNTAQAQVFDAGALQMLATHPKKSEHWILTPHPGEAAALLRTSVQEIQSDRLYAAEQLQKMYGGIIVLKGAGTLICTAHSLSICEAGNPGMASGGMGDVLSGIIGGLLAQHLSLSLAAELGVCLHAAAGDLVAKEQGERGMLASDLMPYFSRLINH